jgi:ABC-type uncharacterized transport system involved in gliding motility auxiliary subunit
MNLDLRRWAPIAYLIGAGLLLVTLALWIVHRRLDTYAQVSLALGLIGLAAGVLFDAERVRRALTGRQMRYGSNALLVSLAFAGILGVLNYLAYSYPQHVDLTEDRVYSLSPETLRLISSLDQPVEIKGFFTPERASSRDDLRTLLDVYRLESKGSVAYEFIDPRQDPISADRYGVTRDASLVVISGEASEVVTLHSETEITSAILRVTNPEQRTIYFLSGHGERDIESTDPPGYSQLRSTLQAKNYLVEQFNLLADAQLPSDAAVLVIAGPQLPLAEVEIAAVEDFLDQGGGLIVLDEPRSATRMEQGDHPLAELLASRHNLILRDDLVVDLNSILPLAGIAVRYGQHPITDRMQNLTTYFPTARSLEIGEGEVEGLARSGLVYTGENSWGETDQAGLIDENRLEFDPQSDVQGPLILAVAVEEFETGARVVVIGDSDFASNSEFFGYGNGDLVVNAIDWASGQEQLISLTPKASTPRFVTPPSVQASGLIFLTTVILLPGGVVLMGVVTWWKRRKG